MFRSKSEGLPDLLNYAAVIDDGIILNKDGSLMAGWYYRGSDVSSVTESERNSISAKLNAALAQLGTGYVTHQDAIRMPAKKYADPKDSFFPDPITQMIDRERQAQFEKDDHHYESIYALVLTYMPPLKRQSGIANMMFEEDTSSPTLLSNMILEQFKSQLMEFEDRLSGVISVQRMKGESVTDESGKTHIQDQLLQYLQFCLTGDNHPVNLPPCPMYIDSILGGTPFYSGITPKIGEKYISVIAIDGFPQESFPGILASLDHIPVHYRWSTRFIYMDSLEAIQHLKTYRKKWQQKVRGFSDQLFKTSSGVVDQDAMHMVNDTEDAISEASSNLVTYGYYTSVIILLDSDPQKIEETARDIRRLIQNLGFGCRVETVNAVEAWLGSLPGHCVPNIRRPMIHTLNLADFLPLSAIWPGKKYCSCPFYPPKSPPLLYAATEGSTPFRLNLHVDDVGHTLIFGPTGSGKSTLLAFMAAQFRRYKGASIFAFDKGNSLLPLTLASGGTHYDIAGEGHEYHFCPLGNIKTKQDQSWAEEWITTLLELQGLQITPKIRHEIHRAMNILKKSQSNTLSDFVTNIQDFSIREALDHYTIKGSMGNLLDSESDDLKTSHFQTFEMEELMNLGDKNLIPVLLYLFHEVERRLTGQPSLLILDEAWIMLGHPVFKDKIREWLKVLRKSNCAVILATQSLSDAVGSGIIDVLNESCPTKIYLPNSKAQEKGSREFYDNLGLNDRQIDIISNATPKRQYYYMSSEGRRLFELNLGPIALSFVGASSKEDIKTIKSLRDSYQDQWPFKWLNKRGILYEHFND
ncbi:MAG: VirB4 family type IV secretion/conjugal transfer ATPase [Candidatus Margulisbacteria bacterium]|nr:VirB4 family type IV secretion/conjugal transfer ATPase [Candidatus Margulisiibacteriota bacterium]